MVFNPRAVFIPDQEAARKARPDDPFTFTVDASKTGWGEVQIDVVYDNRSIRRTFYVEEIGNRIYNVTFTPQEKGGYFVCPLGYTAAEKRYTHLPLYDMK